VDKNEMGRAYGMCGEEEMCICGFGWDLRERHQFKKLGIDDRIILDLEPLLLFIQVAPQLTSRG
jgi:hypothetical protein